MRWLEGWFGTASGVMGALFVAAISLLTPAYSVSSQGGCSTDSSGTTVCYGSMGDGPVNTGPQPGLLILAIVLLILFILIIVGTWLDLSGRRTAGRLILLISVTLMLPLWMVGGPALAHHPAPLALTLPFALLAFVASILSCVRRDAPPAGAIPAQS
ncbi:MAG TPA: hypothetical protein VFU60_04165 [Ktedonobacterales bacterium]|nr:hypothetical protein [Ktedonobacterales bacterium]